MKNKIIVVLCFGVFTFFGITHSVSGQENNTSEPKLHIFSIESNIGGGVLKQKKSDIIAGFGIWYYWRINTWQHSKGKRKSDIGIGIPLRYQMTSSNEDVFINNEHSYSAAALFRLNTFFHPEKETFSVFWGVGPEVRNSFNDNNGIIFNLQQEFGVRIYTPDGILKDNDIGLSVSSTLQDPYRKSGLTFVNFFVRLKLF